MIPKHLVFLLTRRCNFNCDHCSVSAGPMQRETITGVIIKRAIEEAYALPSLRVVIFTGGEPTLYPKLLQTGISLAYEKGFMTRLVTNAWWARTPEKASRFLERLTECGLNEINISYDDFHSPYLQTYGGEQNIINAVSAAKELGLTVLVGTVIHPEAKVRTSYLRQVFQNAGITGELKFLEDFIFPLGRARLRLPRSIFVFDPAEATESGCREAGETLVVLPGGEITFCCGHILCSNAQRLITIGSLTAKETLTGMVERMQRNVLYWWLHLEGPTAVLRELGVTKKVYRRCEGCFYLGTAYWKKLAALATRKEEIFAKWERKGAGVDGVSA
uniref:Radical SAM protein n=1 Tax=Ammonifex degensii TaxID=42838 RepID=A0A7C1IXU2_9THEO